MKQIYDIISETSKEMLIKIVNNRLEDGWKLCGGFTWGGHTYFQAIYKEVGTYEDDDE